MNPVLSVLLIINNYFHDVATAVLLAGAVIMYVLGRSAERGGEAERAALKRVYPLLTRFEQGAIAWIVLGGIPRTIFYNQLEYPVAEYKGLLVALGVKHALMFAAVIAGVVLWRWAATQAEGE